MTRLEIGATIKYSRPLPYYLPSECCQDVLGFVEGCGKVEEEFRGLESFRQAVVKLVQEGLTIPEGCQALESPYVRVRLLAGEDRLKPTLEYNLIVEIERHDTRDVWKIRHWNRDGEIEQFFIIPDAERAVSFLKSMLDHKTGEWASHVVFEGRAVDS